MEEDFCKKTIQLNTMPPEPPINPLDIPLVLEEVLGNLEEVDLLRCSLVNKDWNKEARKKLTKKNFTAIINGRSPCINLISLSKTVGKMEFPFNGLSLNIAKEIHFCTWEMCKPEEAFKNILEMMELKLLKIRWAHDCRVNQCAAIQLLKIIFQKKTQTLLDLHIEDIPARARLYSVGENLWFPNLKRLQLSDEEYAMNLPDNLLKDIIAASPTLESLDLFVEPQDVRFLDHSRYEIIRKVHFDAVESREDGIFYKKLSQIKPKLTGVCACVGDYFEERESFWNILKSSQDSVEVLAMHTTCMQRLQVEKWSPFPITKLVKLGFHMLNDETEHLLRSFNFSSMFPRATSAQVYIAEYDSDEDSDFSEDAMESGEILPVGNGSGIVSLQVDGCISPAGRTLGLLGSVFSNVTHLGINMVDSILLPYRQIWQNFPHLQRLVINDLVLSHYVNFDAEFCGLSELEVRRLQRRDPSFLEKVQVVPTYPALTSLKDLKEVVINFDLLPTIPFPYNRLLFLSDVTGLLVLSRLPKIKLQLNCQFTSDQHFLRHLREFASVGVV